MTDNCQQIIDSFIRATVFVLQTMCNTTGKVGQVSDDRNKAISDDIIGVMGIGGEISGSVVIGLPRSLALRLASEMTGYEEEELGEEDVNDGVTELLNMICGNAKAMLSGTPFAFGLSVPTIIASDEYKISYHHSISLFTMAVDVEGSQFHLQLSLKPSDDNNADLEQAESVSNNAQ